jgi:hypothetical protein
MDIPGYSFFAIFFISDDIASSVGCLNTNTLVLESNALFTVNDGFSVVAPISI